MHSYNIVLKTSDSVSGNVDEYGDTDTASMTYAFDWSFIPDGDYELSYTSKTERYMKTVYLLCLTPYRSQIFILTHTPLAPKLRRKPTASSG